MVFVKVDRKLEHPVAVRGEDRLGFGRVAAAAETAVHVGAFGVVARPGLESGRVEARPEAIGIARVEQPVTHEREERPDAARLVAMNSGGDRDDRQPRIAQLGEQQGARGAHASDFAQPEARSGPQSPPGGSHVLVTGE